MDHWKRYRMVLPRWHFSFVGHVTESNLAIGEGISTSHPLVQFENCKINCVRSFGFHNRKIGSGNVQTIKSACQQIIDQANQGKGKRKGGSCLSKNHSIENTCWLGRMEGFLFKGNVCNQITCINPGNLIEWAVDSLTWQRNWWAL